jgi:poly-gamma-glutamate capsule biosynthesis protein CapA/YwtB (metallophosphatase superfamily)
MKTKDRENKKSPLAILALTAALLPASPRFLRAQDPAVRTDSVTVSAVGDIMAHETQIAAAFDAKTGRYDFGSVYTYVVDLLSRADITLGNFETTLPGQSYSGYPCFGAPDAFARALRDAGFDLLNTANNHSCDKGKAGLTRTLDVLDTLGLMHIGTYRNESEYLKSRVLSVERNGIRLAFLSYAYGTNGIPVPQGTVVSLIDRGRMAGDLRLAHSQNPDFIVVLIHFGTEYRIEPDTSQTALADFLFSEGADVVLGGHPHVLERYGMKEAADRYGVLKKRLVIYSLGNFISHQAKPLRDGGIIFDFTLSRSVSESGDTTRSVGGVRYDPVWVFDGYTDSPNRFLLIPVEQYLDNYRPFDLPEASLRRMRSFDEDTRRRLK